MGGRKQSQVGILLKSRNGFFGVLSRALYESWDGIKNETRYADFSNRNEISRRDGIIYVPPS